MESLKEKSAEFAQTVYVLVFKKSVATCLLVLYNA